MDAQYVEKIPDWATSGYVYTLDKGSYRYDCRGDPYNEIIVGTHPYMSKYRINMLLKSMGQQMHNVDIPLHSEFNHTALQHNNILLVQYDTTFADRLTKLNYRGYVYTLNNEHSLYDDKEDIFNKIYIGACERINYCRLKYLIKAITTGHVNKNGSRITALDETYNKDNHTTNFHDTPITSACKKHFTNSECTCDVVDKAVELQQKFSQHNIRIFQNDELKIEIIDGTVTVRL